MCNIFDELDSLAPNRGQGADSGGVMDRVVSQLLIEMSGIQKSADVFIIGATNRPDLLDPALLRPGRFDRMVYLGVCEDHPSQVKILEALTRKFTLSPNINLNKIAEGLQFNLTGADFYALCSDALLNAIKSKINTIETMLEETMKTDPTITRNKIMENMDLQVIVDENHFQSAVANLTPSVSLEEISRYKYMQSKISIVK